MIERTSRELTLLASAARTASGNGSAVSGMSKYTKFAFELVVSAAAGTTPTLDVKVQHSIDGGTTWFDLVTFAQKTAAGSELKMEADVEGATAEVYGDDFRVTYTIGGTTPSFTFYVKAAAQ